MATVRRRLAQRGARLALVAPRRNFMRLLKAAMLSGYFEVLPSLPAARAS
jgi:anti-anti-sigma regulatory factor